MNWFTIVAQIVNFLILLVILRYLLYKRILKAMDDREAGIAERIENAEIREKEAQETAQEFRLKTEELDNQRFQIIAGAESEAETRGGQILLEVREEARRKKREWLLSLQKEKETFLGRLRLSAAMRVLDTTRLVLADMAGVDLNSRMVEKFVDILSALSDDELTLIVKAAKENGNIVVVSSFELDDNTKSSLLSVIETKFGGDIETSFDIDTEKLAGIELRVGGRKIEWSLANYIDDMEERMNSAFEELSSRNKPETDSSEEQKTSENGDGQN